MMSTRAGRSRPVGFSSVTLQVESSPNRMLVGNDTNAYLSAGLTGLGIIQAPTYAVHDAWPAPSAIKQEHTRREKSLAKMERLGP